jgi:hypothetical protein
MQLLPELGDVFVLEASSFRLGFHHKLDLAEVGVQHLEKEKKMLTRFILRNHIISKQFCPTLQLDKSRLS